MKEATFRNEVMPLKDQLFRLALRITLNREDAEDIVQETLIRVWRELQAERPIDHTAAFALTICRNLSLDLTEKKAHQNVPLNETLHDRPDPSAQAPDQLLASNERYDQLLRTIDRLPEKQRTALQLRDMEGRTYKDIAAVMHITESDVKVNIFRARRKLKELMLAP